MNVAAGNITVDLGTGAQTVPLPAVANPPSLATVAAILENAIRTALPADRLFAQATVTLEFDGTRLRVAPGRNSPDYTPTTIVAIADTGGGTFANTFQQEC